MRLAVYPRGGVGDCSQITTGAFGCRDNSTGNMVACTDAVCGAASPAAPPPNTSTFYSAPAPTFSTQQFGNSTTTTFNLDSYLAQWTSQITGQSIASLVNQGMGSVSAIISQLQAVAQQYCQVEAPSDCGNISAIVAKYSAIIQSAFVGVNPAQWNPATTTAYAPVTSPTAVQNVLNPPPMTIQETLPPIQQVTQNPLTPATTGNPLANTVSATNNSLNAGNSINQMPAGNTGTGGNTDIMMGTFDVSTFLSQYGIWIAVGVGALLLLPALTKR